MAFPAPRAASVIPTPHTSSDRTTVAVARKLAVLAWHLLTREEDYAFARPGIVARKRRRLELPPARRAANPAPTATRVWASTAQHRAERRIAEQAETTYRRLIADWRATGPTAGASATPERASQRPSKGKAARQATSS
jgi:transposase